MTEDWAADVRKYAPEADEATIAGIVRYCGISLQNRDAAMVSFTDRAETDRVRENFCRRKLGLTGDDAELDAAIARVGERMGGDPTKNRVTVYYLLADAFGKLGVFGAAGPDRAAATAVPLRPAEGRAPVMAAGAVAPAAAMRRRAAREADGGGLGATALVALGAMGAIILGAATAGSLIGGRSSEVSAPIDPPATFAAPSAAMPVPAVAAPAPAIPEGSGVIAQDIAGKPQVSVYFDTAKSDVSPDFATAAAPIKTWVDGHPGARLAVSGFNDPRGNAALNAELSKNRAKSVAAALAKLGVPAAVIDLEKPPETTDQTSSQTQARRVDIVVKGGS